MFSNIIFWKDAKTVSNFETLRRCHATACKSLYDAPIAANFNTEEEKACRLYNLAMACADGGAAVPARLGMLHPPSLKLCVG